MTPDRTPRSGAAVLVAELPRCPKCGGVAFEVTATRASISGDEVKQQYATCRTDQCYQRVLIKWV